MARFVKRKNHTFQHHRLNEFLSFKLGGLKAFRFGIDAFDTS